MSNLKIGDIIVHKETKERFKVIKIERKIIYIDDEKGDNKHYE